MRIHAATATFALFFLLAGCDALVVGPEYTQATITSVVLSDMPFAKSNGSSWDPSGGGGPDVYTGLMDGNGNQVATGSTIDNVSPNSLPLSWGINHTVYNLDEPLEVGFADEDYDENDYIGGVSFTLSDYKDDGPSSFVVNNGGIEVKITAEWSE